MLLSQRHPLLYKASIATHRLKRRLDWHSPRHRYARTRSGKFLPFRIFKHKSLLLRKLGDADMRLQHNKVKNLSLAVEKIDGVLIRPGETFSIWRLVGEPTAEKGYLEGMLLSNGEVKAGIGGGLCQLANLLHWMFLHSALTVTERHHHSFDAFPDSGRVLPFGTGATIFYNYVDLQAYNPTRTTYQLRLWLTDEHLCGELLASEEPAERYHVFERDHAFVFDVKKQKHFRRNVIWREARDAKSGNVRREEELFRNFAPMKYLPPEGTVVESLG